MSKNKNLLGILLVMLLIFLPAKNVNADAVNKEALNRDFICINDYELYGYASRMYDSEEPLVIEDFSVIDMYIQSENVSFENNGDVEFIDIIGVLQDGQYINLSRYVTWTTSDSNVASCNLGRILAEGVGECQVTASYNDLSVIINVSVASYVDWEAYMSELISEVSIAPYNYDVTPYSVPSSSLNSVLNRASNMCYVAWTPTKQFRLNDGSYQSANVQRKGIPYSLKSAQYNEVTFLTKLTASDFYNENPRVKPSGATVYDAQYGLDCSGFVSFAWGTPRRTTGTYLSAINSGGNNEYIKVGTYTYKEKDSNGETLDYKKRYVQSELVTAYQSLNVGDAIVTNGHVRLVISNNKTDNKITCQEAGGNSPAVYTYSYSTLSSAGYLPFTITTTYFNSCN